MRLPSAQVGLTAHRQACLPNKLTERKLLFLLFVLATSYSRLATTIASRGLNCRVRKENGCGPSDKSPGQKEQTYSLKTEERSYFTRKASFEGHGTRKIQKTQFRRNLQAKSCRALRDSHNSLREFCRGISTPRLSALLHVHLAPINVVISHGPITIPNLGVGFPLRCFQRLSDPDIATGRCRWYDSPQTRGRFISVLSY